MSRVGVKREIAERVLGHAIPGVEGVYDRHHYDEQKGAALLALAGIIQNLAGLDNSTGGPITTIRAEGSLDRYGAAAQS